MICHSVGLSVVFWIFLVIAVIGAINWLWVAIAPSQPGGVVGWIVGQKGQSSSLAARIIFGAVGIAGIIVLILAIMCHVMKY